MPKFSPIWRIKFIHSTIVFVRTPQISQARPKVFTTYVEFTLAACTFEH